MLKPKSEICPICHSPAIKDFDPFCSKMCKNKDLLGWLDEKYRIPCEDSKEEEDEPSTDSVQDRT